MFDNLGDMLGNFQSQFTNSDLQDLAQVLVKGEADPMSIIGQLTGQETFTQIQSSVQQGDMQGAINQIQSAATGNQNLQDLISSIGGLGNLQDILARFTGK